MPVFFIIWTILPFISGGNLRVEIGFAPDRPAPAQPADLHLLPAEGASKRTVPLEGSSEAIEARLAGLEDTST